jgi:hypothetical protein
MVSARIRASLAVFSAFITAAESGCSHRFWAWLNIVHASALAASVMVSHLLSHAKHFGGLRVVMSTLVGLLPHWWPHRRHHRSKRPQPLKMAAEVHGRCPPLLTLLQVDAEIVIRLFVSECGAPL